MGRNKKFQSRSSSTLPRICIPVHVTILNSLWYDHSTRKVLSPDSEWLQRNGSERHIKPIKPDQHRRWKALPIWHGLHHEALKKIHFLRLWLHVHHNTGVFGLYRMAHTVLDCPLKHLENALPPLIDRVILLQQLYLADASCPLQPHKNKI